MPSCVLGDDRRSTRTCAVRRRPVRTCECHALNRSRLGARALAVGGSSGRDGAILSSGEGHSPRVGGGHGGGCGDAPTLAARTWSRHISRGASRSADPARPCSVGRRPARVVVTGRFAKQDVSVQSFGLFRFQPSLAARRHRRTRPRHISRREGWTLDARGFSLTYVDGVAWRPSGTSPKPLARLVRPACTETRALVTLGRSAPRCGARVVASRDRPAARS